MAISKGLRLVAGVLVLAFILGGCGGKDNPPPPPPPPQADLVMNAFTAPSTGTPGALISLTDTVRNNGNAAAGSFEVGIYLSTDSTVTTTDTFLGSRVVSSLAAGANNSFSGTVQLPSNIAGGVYFIAAIADDLNTVAESNNSNNVSTAVQITIASGSTPDLSTVTFTGPSSGTSGASISVNSTVTNFGGVAAGAFTIGIYLSTNNTISTSDTLLGTRSVTSLASGASSSGATSVTLPSGLTSGTYYLGAIADHASAITESNETNNISSPVTIAITGASTADLVMSTFTAPTTGTAGGSISITDTVTNSGSGSAGAFEVGIYLSTDNTITTGDTLLGFRAVSSLGAGASSSGSGTVTLPSSLSPGTYFLGAIADDLSQVSESNEGNNVSSVRTISIGGAGAAADLAMTAFTASSTGTPGGTISITDTVTNNGSASASAFFVGLYLSTDATVTTSDTVIAFRDIAAGLPAGQSSSGSGTVSLPGNLTPGTYFIAAIADDLNEVAESNESNNVSTVRSIAISGSAACTPDAFESDDVRTSAKTITVGASAQSHNFCDDATDWVSFSATGGVFYTLETFISSGEADTVVELFGTNGTTLLAFDDDKNFPTDLGSRIVWQAPASGTYFARISNYSGVSSSNSPYTVRLTSP